MRIGRLREEQPYLMCLQDPSNPVNDLGARCHAFKHIQETIKVMHAELARSMEEYDSTNPDSKLRNGEPRESLLTPLVGRCHELYAERRERMVARTLNTLPAGVVFRRVMGDSPLSFREDLPPRDELRAEHNAKTRKRSGMHALSAHVVVESCDLGRNDEILAELRTMLAERFHLEHTTIQIETPSHCAGIEFH